MELTEFASTDAFLDRTCHCLEREVAFSGRPSQGKECVVGWIFLPFLRLLALPVGCRNPDGKPPLSSM